MKDCKRREENLSQELTQLGDRLKQTGHSAIQREAQLQHEVESLTNALRERDIAKASADELLATITAELQAMSESLVSVTQDQKTMQSQLAEKTWALAHSEAMLRDQEELLSRLGDADAKLSESEQWWAELAASIATLGETRAAESAAVEERLHSAEAKLQVQGELEKRLHDAEATANVAQSQLAEAEGKLRDANSKLEDANSVQLELEKMDGRLQDGQAKIHSVEIELASATYAC
jgi:chromosome segregation ATPase